MRILLYIYGKLVREEFFCHVVRNAHKRDLPTLFFIMSSYRKNGKFLTYQTDIMERILKSGQ